MVTSYTAVYLLTNARLRNALAKTLLWGFVRFAGYAVSKVGLVRLFSVILVSLIISAFKSPAPLIPAMARALM